MTISKTVDGSALKKIDGTNIHFDVVFSFQYVENGSVEVSVNHTICGRTAKAQIPAHLYKKLEEIISRSDSRGRLVDQAFESAISKAIEYVKKGFKSTIAENPDYDAEGLVLKTPYCLQFRNGQRIITKIKTCDFQKYRQKYGDGPVEQNPNPNYKK